MKKIGPNDFLKLIMEDRKRRNYFFKLSKDDFKLNFYDQQKYYSKMKEGDFY
jgi:hypothetical protein